MPTTTGPTGPSQPCHRGRGRPLRLQVTWDYYKHAHGRNGISNDGKGAPSTCHYGKNYANAFWDDTCFA